MNPHVFKISLAADPYNPSRLEETPEAYYFVQEQVGDAETAVPVIDFVFALLAATEVNTAVYVAMATIAPVIHIPAVIAVAAVAPAIPPATRPVMIRASADLARDAKKTIMNKVIKNLIFISPPKEFQMPFSKKS